MDAFCEENTKQLQRSFPRNLSYSTIMECDTLDLGFDMKQKFAELFNFMNNYETMKIYNQSELGKVKYLNLESISDLVKKNLDCTQNQVNREMCVEEELQDQASHIMSVAKVLQMIINKERSIYSKLYFDISDCRKAINSLVDYINCSFNQTLDKQEKEIERLQTSITKLQYELLEGNIIYNDYVEYAVSRIDILENKLKTANETLETDNADLTLLKEINCTLESDKTRLIDENNALMNESTLLTKKITDLNMTLQCEEMSYSHIETILDMSLHKLKSYESEGNAQAKHKNVSYFNRDKRIGYRKSIKRSNVRSAKSSVRSSLTDSIISETNSLPMLESIKYLSDDILSSRLLSQKSHSTNSASPVIPKKSNKSKSKMFSNSFMKRSISSNSMSSLSSDRLPTIHDNRILKGDKPYIDIDSNKSMMRSEDSGISLNEIEDNLKVTDDVINTLATISMLNDKMPKLKEKNTRKGAKRSASFIGLVKNQLKRKNRSKTCTDFSEVYLQNKN